MRLLILLCFAGSFIGLSAQKLPTVEILSAGTNTSIRGMSIPADKIIWVSGSHGTVGKSVDAGKSWRWLLVPGFEKRDFRDIEAFDSSTAIAMAVDNPAVIVKTTDGGTTWRKVFERTLDGMFLDAMDFKNSKEGICIGDPLVLDSSGSKRFYIIRTFDSGDSWKEISLTDMPVASTGEAIFAASGSNISFVTNPAFEYVFVTGGMVTNMHFIAKESRGNKTIGIPLVHGKESSGTFAMASDRQKKFYCVGGNYKVPGDSTSNYQYTTDAATTWHAATTPPGGYRSGLCIIEGRSLLSSGTSGVDFTKNEGRDWQKVSDESFNVCTAGAGKMVFLAGEKGKIARLVF